MTPHEAAVEGDLDQVKYLVQTNPASVNTTNIKGATPVYLAAMYGRHEVVKYLVEEAEADAFIKDKWGFTAFHWIATWGWLDVVKYLAEKYPAGVNIKDNYWEQTALDWAKCCCKADDCSSVVEYLIPLFPRRTIRPNIENVFVPLVG